MTSVANEFASMKYDRTVDWSGFADIAFWVYHPGWTNEVGRIALNTDVDNYKVWDFDFAGSWTEIIIDLSSVPSGSAGTLDLSNIAWIVVFEWNSEDPGEDYYFDFFHSRTVDITSDVINGLSFIETPIRDFHRLEFMAKGTWTLARDYIIVIFDYYTSNGSSTANQIIFEGSIVDYELSFPRKIWCHSRAKQDLDEFRPSGVYNGDLDSNHIKTLIAECSYITEGTIDATVGNTDNTFKGDKTFRSILNDWADKHLKHWYLSPTGVLNFNDADVDSGEDFDQADTIWNVRPKQHVDAINWVVLLGAIVNGVQISAESKDQNSIDELGAKLYKDTYALIESVAQLQIAADNLRTREQLLPLAINFWYYRANKGLIQVCETVTFEHNKMNPAITSRQVILNKVIYRFLSGHTNLQTTDGIAFKKDKDASLPQENSLLIQQNATQSDHFVWRTPEKTANDWDFTALGAVSTVELDFSAIVPAGATTAYMKVWIEDGGLNHVYTRHTSQVSTFQIDMFRVTVINQWDNKIMICPLDSNYKCDFASSTNFNNWTTLTGVVVGWDV